VAPESVAGVPHRPVGGQVGVEDDHRAPPGDRGRGELRERYTVGHPAVAAGDADHEPAGRVGGNGGEALLGALDDDQFGHLGQVELGHPGMHPHHQIGTCGPEVLAGVALGENDGGVRSVLVDAAAIHVAPREQESRERLPVSA
jgi:hypothetical protein